MHRYLYEGPVMEFNTCINERWEAETVAETEKKAKSNLAYRYKKMTGKLASSKITLPGELVILD